MAEESFHTSTTSHKPQQTLVSVDQSLNNPPLTNLNLGDDFSQEKSSLYCVNQVSEVSNQVKADINNISGVQLVENQETFKGFLDKPGLGCVPVEKLNLDQVTSDNDEISGAQLLKNQEIFKGFLDRASLNCNDTNNDVGFDSKDEDNVVVESSDSVEKKGRKRGKKGNCNDVRKLKYSRKLLVKLRFVNGKSQKKIWQSIYNSFDDDVKKEYNELASFRQNKNQAGGKRKHCDQGTIGDSSTESMIHDGERKDSADVTLDDEDLAEWTEVEESDDEYQSIRRPAFLVEGEPNFESGPPEDGFEYLRRVRWEAAHVPQVKVVKLDRSKLTEQSVYMPNIPDIEKCPPHLAPLKQWEDEFIADFSELRMALSIMMGETNDATSLDSDSIIFSRPQFTNRSSKSLPTLELPEGGPTISTLIAMEPVTRVALLTKRISLFESADNLSKDDYAWLFALCVVIDTPLDADTAASLRGLLRRCAKLRANKDEFDDELVMLNILVTIVGKIFGQSEN